MEEFLSRLEVVELLGISTVTLWHWEKQGKLVPLRDIGGHVFYDPQDIKDFLSQKEREGKIKI